MSSSKSGRKSSLQPAASSQPNEDLQSYIAIQVVSWMEHVPVELRPAVFAVCDRFEEDEKKTRIDTLYCGVWFIQDEYEKAVQVYIPGLRKYAEDEDAWRGFEWMLRQQDPAEVFLASFELYVHGMEHSLRHAFRDLLKTAEKHCIAGPVAWAQEKAMYLSRAHTDKVRLWIENSAL
jgi:hypothetical protein